MKETSPSFQFYPDDFESDENVIVMSNAEVGLYWRLICRCWKEQSLPEDPSVIARMTRSPIGEIRRLWPKVRVCFTPDENGRLRHGRLDFEREKQADFRSKQSARSVKRWQSQRIPTEVPRESQGNAVPAMPDDAPPTPSPIPKDSPNGESAPTARNLTLLPKDPSTIPARALCEAAYPIVRGHVDLAKTKTDWVKRNMNSARALHKAGKTPEQVVAALTTAYENPTARELYGRITSLAKLQEHWPALRDHASGKVRSLRREPQRTANLGTDASTDPRYQQ